MIDTKKASEQEWNTAQHVEFSVWGGYNVGDGDDWSEYWKENMDNYDLIKGKYYKNVIEVGCGPFGKNLAKILRLISYERLFVLDPLLSKYCFNQKSGIHKLCEEYNIEKISIPLEEYTQHNNTIDLMICNNVLDHCYDADLCFDNMYNALNGNGILIFGNDLKDEKDILIARDHMHPIMLQEQYLEEKFAEYASRSCGFKTLYKKYIARNECRNPEACCGCIFAIFQKAPK
jgi:SAM-dependent methyltransferase